MLKEFIDFCSELFPSINPYTVDGLKSAMEQFELHGKTFPVCLNKPLEYLSQGDVFSELPFTFFDENGEENVIYRKALLLSNTCDASRKNSLIFVALQNIDKGSNSGASLAFSDATLKDIKNNKLSQYMYLPSEIIKNDVVDFGVINTFSRELILEMIDKKKLNKLLSLNNYGFYILLSKITILFCRRQDMETEKDRQAGLS